MLILIPIFSALIFGLYPPAAKMAYHHGANQIFIIIITTFFRAIVMIGLAGFQGYDLHSIYRNSKISVFSGFVQALSVVGILASLVYIPAAVTVTVLFTYTIILLLILTYFGEIKINKFIVLIILCALFGISLLVGLYDQTEKINLIGLMLATMAALATATRMYSFGKQVQVQNYVIVGAQVFTFAFLSTLALLFYQLPSVPTNIEGWLWTALCCGSLGCGTVGMFLGIHKLGVFKSSLFLKCEPIFTAIFSVLILREYLTLSQYLGMFIIIVSLISYQVYENVLISRRI